MNKIWIKEKTRSPAIFSNKERQTGEMCRQQKDALPVGSLAFLPCLDPKRATRNVEDLPHLNPWRHSASPKAPFLRRGPRFQVQNPKRFAFVAQIPHCWRCLETKCNERELNTPKVSENLVRFTFPVFTVGDRSNSWKYFNHISKIFTKAKTILKKWIWMRTCIVIHIDYPRGSF